MNFFQIFYRLRSKLCDFRANIAALTPYQKWKLVHFCGDTPLRMLGVNVLNDCHWIWITPISGLTIPLVFIVQAYTMWFYWHENKITAIQPLAMTAMVVQVREYLSDFGYLYQKYLDCCGQVLPASISNAPIGRLNIVQTHFAPTLFSAYLYVDDCTEMYPSMYLRLNRFETEIMYGHLK